MRAFALPASLVLAVICFVTGFSRAETPRDRSGTVDIYACNESGLYQLALALMTAIGTGKWQIKGWYILNDTGCTAMGRYPKANFYTHVMGPAGHTWGRGDTHQCIDLKNIFDRVVGTQGYKCQGNDELVPFTEWEVTEKDHRVNVTFR
jgi:hypothetical protein